MKNSFTRCGSVAMGVVVADYAIYSVLNFLGAELLIAQGIARLAGGLMSFIANKTWSFEKKDGSSIARPMRRFLLLYVFSYALSMSLFFVLSEIVGFEPYPAKIAADLSCFLVNFIVMRHYVFSGAAGFTQLVLDRITKS